MSEPIYWIDTARGEGRSPCVIDYVGAEEEERIPCPLSQEHCADIRRLSDLYLKVRLPLPDFIADGWSNTFVANWLASERVVSLFKQHGITGYKLRPARVLIAKWKRRKNAEYGGEWVNSPPDAAPTYHEIVTTGWGGLVHPASGMRPIRHCPGCGHTDYTPMTDPSKLFDASQWDGSDWFGIWPMDQPFVTSRLKALIEEHALTGIRFRRVRDAKAPELIEGEDYTCRGGLRFVLEEPRASKIGKPLGIY